ncbi:MAG: leucine-rich repeat protein [Lachnospiraceae bacterium]|nr:leucine-rich repeat protein [Lachnospiraceae bacterium]
MKLKQMMAIGLSTAIVLAAMPGGTVVLANEKQSSTATVSNDETSKDIAKETSEYGNLVASDTIADTDVTWSVYDSGTLVIEGTGVTPDWSPWFEYKEQITDVIIGDGITTLGERNFMNYPNLKSVTMKGALSKISNSAFEGCKKLTSITASGKTNAAGKKVLQLGECVFKDCTGLKSAEFSGSLAVAKNAFEGCTSLNSITATDSEMALLANYAFINCTNLTEVNLPGKLLIQEGAFCDCTSLKKFDFSKVSSLGRIAFYNCSSLESIEFPETVTVINDSTFQNCSSLTSLNIPGTVKTIGANAFSGCKNLKELKIEDGVTSIGEYAFTGCENLETVTLPKTATIGDCIISDYKPVKTIRYSGTREEWLKAGLHSENFYNAKVYYEYKADHEHSFVTYTYTYPDSCTEPGKKVTECKYCGYVKSEEVIPAAHKFMPWKTTKAATIFAPAEQTRSCSVCGYEETRSNGKKLPATIKVNATKLPLKVKQKTTALKVSGLTKGDSIVSWKSSNSKVVKVSGKSNGTCTLTAGSKKGKATITVTLKSGLKKKITITVQKDAVKTTKITGIAKSLKLKKNQTAKLKASVAPLTSLQKVTYKSSNTKVATVTSKGVVKAKKKGTAVITVKSGSKTVKCKVTVK